LLTDDSFEILDMSSLNAGRDNVLYCRVKNGRFTARFSRKSYYQLAAFIEQSENDARFFIHLNGVQYVIDERQKQA
jgi:hypothetical protein